MKPFTHGGHKMDYPEDFSKWALRKMLDESGTKRALRSLELYFDNIDNTIRIGMEALN